MMLCEITLSFVNCFRFFLNLKYPGLIEIMFENGFELGCCSTIHFEVNQVENDWCGRLFPVGRIMIGRAELQIAA